MTKTFKRNLSAAAAAVIALSVFTGTIPANYTGISENYSISASAETVVASGVCGANAENDLVTDVDTYDFNSNVKWKIVENGGKVPGTDKAAYTLIIDGKGAMASFEHDELVPWFNYSANVTDVIILDGITSIGINAFSNWNGQFENLRIVCIGKDVRYIGKYAFEYCTKLSYIWFENEETLKSLPNGEWNIYTDEEGGSAFFGVGIDSEEVLNGEHVVYMYTQQDRNSDTSFQKAVSFGKEYDELVNVKATVKKEFDVSKMGYGNFEFNFKTLFANMPEGTVAYRKIAYDISPSKYKVVKLTAEDLNNMYFKQARSSIDDLYIKLPENYNINKKKETGTIYLGGLLEYYEVVNGEITQQGIDNTLRTALKNVNYDYVFHFGSGNDEFWAIRYDSPYTKVDAKVATCVENGNVSYWYDEENDKYYADNKGTQEIKKEDTVIKATGIHYYVNGKCVMCGKWRKAASDYYTIKKDGIEYNVYNEYAEVADCNEDLTTANILSEVGGVPVVTIAENAFNSKKQLTKVNIPESVTTIRKGAFWGVDNIEDIDVPENVTKIENGAFVHCDNLKRITIMNKECKIGMSSSTISNSYDNNASLYTYTGTIYGLEGSTAEEYAKAYNYNFAPVADKVERIYVGSNGKIIWNKATNATSYRVLKKFNNKTFYSPQTKDTTYTMNSNTQVAYDIVIRSYNADGEYVDSEPKSVATKSLGVAKAPRLDNNLGVLDWDPVEGATSYRVVKRVGGKEYYGEKVEKTDYNAYMVHYDSLYSYDFFIRAYDDKGNYTDGEILHKNGEAIGKVKEVEFDENGIMEWEALPNAVVYKVGKVVDGKTYYSNYLFGTTYKFNNVPTKDYQVFVVAFNIAGEKSYGPKIDVKVNK